MSQNDVEAFVVNRLRSKPVSYSVQIDHFVSGDHWQMAASVHGVTEDQVNRERVAADLRHAADLMEGKR